MPITPEGRKISEYDLAGTLSGQEWFPLVQSGQTKRTQLATINDYNNGSCKCTLVSRSNTIGTDADTLTKYLHTDTLDGDTLSNNNERLTIKVLGITGATNNSKTITVGFGSSTIYTVTTTANNTVFFIDIELIRVSETQQKAVGFSNFTASDAPYFIITSETLSNDIPMFVSASSAQDVTPASANDVVAHVYFVDLHKLDPDS